jgi:hypothetical protein
MFQNTKTTVSQGAVGLAAAVFYYQKSGYCVLLPLIDNQGYDLVVEKDGILKTVQCKTTRAKKNNTYLVQLKKVRPNRTGNVISVLEKCDLLFVLCETGDMYSIPYESLTSLNELRLNSKIEQWKVS